MEGLEPSTSPLPRECSATELHQPCSRAARWWCIRPIHTRNAKNPNTTHASDRYRPGSIVKYTPTAAIAIPSRATTMRCCDPGPSIGLIPAPDFKAPHSKLRVPHKNCGAQGRIRTSVTRCVADLQSAAINHSATCALVAARLGISGWSWRRDLNPRPSDYKSDALPAELRQPAFYQPTQAPAQNRHQTANNAANDAQRCH